MFSELQKDADDKMDCVDDLWRQLMLRLSYYILPTSDKQSQEASNSVKIVFRRKKGFGDNALCKGDGDPISSPKCQQSFLYIIFRASDISYFSGTFFRVEFH